MSKVMGRTEEKNSGRSVGTKLALTALKVIGIGLVSGIALIAGTDKAMKKAFPEDEKMEETEENGK